MDYTVCIFLLQICTIVHGNDFFNMVGLFPCSRLIKGYSILALGLQFPSHNGYLYWTVFVVHILKNLPQTYERSDNGYSNFSDVT